jgi:hypothetical protein
VAIVAAVLQTLVSPSKEYLIIDQEIDGMRRQSC